MALETRRPTGRPPWPIIVLAGIEKAGKSWAAAEASGSDLIGRTLWISTGEDDPDEYGAVPGANFEIVLHNGTYRDILRAVREAVDAPTVDGKPTLIVLDSGTILWDLLRDMAQAEANRRAAKKSGGREVVEADIHSDLWNIATQRWRHVLNALRRHNGPSVITARLDVVTVFENGQPTKHKATKVQAQKSLPFDAGAIVEMPARGEAWLTGLRSVKYPLKQDRVKLDDFTLDKLWRQLGLDAEDATTARQHSGVHVDPEHIADTADAARTALLEACKTHRRQPGTVAAHYEAMNGIRLLDETDPEPIRALITEITSAGTS